MKKLIIPIIALALLFTSCGETKEEVKSESSETESQVDEKIEETIEEKSPNLMYKEGEIETESEELLNMEVEDVDPNLFDNLCNEEVVSDCYIVDHFQYMKATYINVDFVNYKVISADSEPELVNEIKTIRTFLVEDEYDDCSGEHGDSIEKILATAKENPFTLFRLESNEGIVSVLFEKRCGE